jgi:hypothetical protein
MRDPKTGSDENDNLDEERDDMEQDETASAPLFDMLRNDHRHVQELFTKFEDADQRTRSSLAEEALLALEVHTALEEEMVYPAMAEVVDEEELVAEAREEHHVAKLLIKELHKMNAEDNAFAVKFKVLGDMVGRHIEQEEHELFPQAEEGGVETEDFSRQVVTRKAKLTQKFQKKSSASSRRRKAA